MKAIVINIAVSIICDVIVDTLFLIHLWFTFFSRILAKYPYVPALRTDKPEATTKDEDSTPLNSA